MSPWSQGSCLNRQRMSSRAHFQPDARALCSPLKQKRVQSTLRLAHNTMTVRATPPQRSAATFQPCKGDVWGKHSPTFQVKTIFETEAAERKHHTASEGRVKAMQGSGRPRWLTPSSLSVHERGRQGRTHGSGIHEHRTRFTGKKITNKFNLVPKILRPRQRFSRHFHYFNFHTKTALALLAYHCHVFTQSKLSVRRAAGQFPPLPGHCLNSGTQLGRPSRLAGSGSTAAHPPSPGHKESVSLSRP